MKTQGFTIGIELLHAFKDVKSDASKTFLLQINLLMIRDLANGAMVLSITVQEYCGNSAHTWCQRS